MEVPDRIADVGIRRSPGGVGDWPAAACCSQTSDLAKESSCRIGVVIGSPNALVGS
jgi:hypothetical protein